MTEYSMVRIEWTDASSRARGWVTMDEIEPVVSVIISVGFLVRENSEFMTLASSFTREDAVERHFCEVTHIPVGSIRSIKRLRTRGA